MFNTGLLCGYCKDKHCSAFVNYKYMEKFRFLVAKTFFDYVHLIFLNGEK